MTRNAPLQSPPFLFTPLLVKEHYTEVVFLLSIERLANAFTWHFPPSRLKASPDDDDAPHLVVTKRGLAAERYPPPPPPQM
jgi:hypothetical protein